MFRYHGWTFYFLIAPKGKYSTTMRMVARHGRKLLAARIHRRYYGRPRPRPHIKIPGISFILRRLTGVRFKLMNFKFVINHGKIYFGRRPVKLTRSKNKKYP